MFGRKKDDNAKKKRRSGGSGGLAQFGLIDIPDFDNLDKMNGMGNEDDDDDDDEALEAELLALTSGATPTRKPKKPPVAVAPAHLDKMVAESLRDIPSDESVSGDDDDPALLEELTGLVSDEEADPPTLPQPVVQEPLRKAEPAAKSDGGLESLLNERLEMYKKAEENAKSAGEAARARRFNRGIKTLGDLLKQVKAGRPIDEGEIPPPVAVQVTKKPTAPAEIDQPESDSQPPSSPPPSFPAPPPVPPRSALPSVPQRVAPSPPSLPGAVPLPELTKVPLEPSLPVSNPVSIEPPADVERDHTKETFDEKEGILKLLTSRRDEYKIAAVKAKREGDVETALRYVKIAKQFDAVISAVNEGKPVDLSAMPPAPPIMDQTNNHVSEQPAPVSPINDRKQDQEKQQSCEPPASSEPQMEEGASAVEEEEVHLITAGSVLEALEQRLKVYQGQEEAARAADNSSKARRMGRIVKQYQDAIKLHKAGKPVPVDDLPTPPGYAPIPVKSVAGGSAAISPKTPASPKMPSAAPAADSPVKPVVAPSSKPSPPTSPEQSKPDQPVKSGSDGSTDKATQKIIARRGAVERQMSFLTSRQKEFRLAALEAKKKGEINQAKEFLRLAKGFEPLLDAASSGLPIDMDSVPIPPSSKVVLESDFDVITANDCNPNSDSEIFDKLQSDLSAQLKMCMQTRNHFKAIGDVASANRFEQLALHSKKDLDVLRVAQKRNEPVPRFHYETKSFSIVQCNTDLTDNDLELTFIQGVNYNVPNPKEVDTYIKFEFPYPSDDPPKDKTSVVYNTNNPEYNATFPLTIHRNSRACQRVFKRHSIKCEVWAKGGFFRYDSLIGTASVKLQPLETKCTLHDSFDLMDGRKTVGGKLEVKIRIRNPILTKQVEQVQEKWLVIDH